MSRVFSFVFLSFAALFVLFGQSPHTIQFRQPDTHDDTITITILQTYTVYSMSWSSQTVITKTEYVTDVLQDWDPPQDAPIFGWEWRVKHDPDPQWKIWYYYEGVRPVTKERIVYASGIGKDPEPYYAPFVLGDGEYVANSFVIGFVNLIDKDGVIHTILFPNEIVEGDYMDYDVGMEVSLELIMPAPVPNMDWKIAAR